MNVKSESEVPRAFGNRKTFEPDPWTFLQLGWTVVTCTHGGLPSTACAATYLGVSGSAVVSHAIVNP